MVRLLAITYTLHKIEISAYSKFRPWSEWIHCGIARYKNRAPSNTLANIGTLRFLFGTARESSVYTSVIISAFSNPTQAVWVL